MRLFLGNRFFSQAKEMKRLKRIARPGTRGALEGLGVVIGVGGAQAFGLGDGEQAVVGREEGQGRRSDLDEIRFLRRTA